MASNLGPPCPGCGHTGRKNQQVRLDWKFRCVNMSCDVMCYSLQDSVDGEAFRLGRAPQPAISSHKQPQIGLFGKDNTTPGGTSRKDEPTGSVAAIDGPGTRNQVKKEVA